ncbi:MAG: polyprenyl synthetase family protein, partial [Flavobacteriales bacterium]
IISNASEEDQTYIYNFAIELGLSFQLWDDYLDTFGDSTKVGKQVGGDILANKKTFLMIKAMELADDAQRSATAELLSSNESSELKVNRVTQHYKDFHLDQLLKSTVENYYKRALENLDALGIDESRKLKIRALAEALHGREF